MSKSNANKPEGLTGLNLRKNHPVDKKISAALAKDMLLGHTKSAAMRRLMLDGIKYREQQK